MQPKTSVRPIIAGARRQQLSDLLRRWRQQPRKRSPHLFSTLLALALLSDCGLLFVVVRFLSARDSSLPAPAERRILVPYASDSDLWEPLRHGVVHVDGRTRLFESFCREAVQRITGEERFEGRDPLAVVVSWMLEDGANAAQWDNYPFLRCENAELRALLYREEGGPSRMGREEQLHGRYVEPAVVRSLPEIQSPSLERQIVELRDRLNLFDRIRGGCVEDGSGEGMQTARAALSEAYHSGDKDLFAAALSDYVEASREALRVEEVPAECRGLGWEARVQTWLSLSAYAVLALAWGVAALALARILLTAPSSEQLYRWAKLCLWPIRTGMVLLAASALLDGLQVMHQGFSWYGWNAQTVGTCFVFPSCVVLLYARRRGWLPPFRLLAVVVLGFALLAVMSHAGLRGRTADLYVGDAFSADAAIYVAGLISVSLTAHAALRYYFGRQHLFVV